MAESLRISVVIATYNREKYIGKALMGLLQQDLPFSAFEVLIIDNNCSDATMQVVGAFQAEHPELLVRTMLETQQGLSYGRNRGVQESRASIITFLDDDAVAPPDFLSKAIAYLDARPELLAVGGKIEPEFVDGKPEWYTKYYWGVTGQFDAGDSEGAMLNWGKFPCGSNMTFRRRFFDEYGLFNPNLGRKGAILLAGEEKELFGRVKGEDRQRIWYYPDLTVGHLVDNQKLHAGYLKKFCIGFALGERLEVAQATFPVRFRRYAEFSAKSLGTLLLGIGYLLNGEPAKASMIVRFGAWIFKGLWFTKMPRI
jgi:glycosyltransferase involved in cell wall biosynthesis